MRQLFLSLLIMTAVFLFGHRSVADTIRLSTGRTVTGTVLQTNAADVVMLTDLGALSYAKALIEEIKVDNLEEPDRDRAYRLPDAKHAIAVLAAQPWAGNLKQIPATVIDTGILKNVPYASFRCGEDYEVNVYGDPDQPACVEIGVYRKLTEDPSARRNCLSFITAVLGREDDQAAVRELDPAKDLKTNAGLTFEITPPSAPDAYLGWWVSVYSEHSLEGARATTDELKEISVNKADVAKTSAKEEKDSWSQDDLKLSRPSATVLSFVTKSGVEITNAEVKPYVEGVSLIWRDTNSGAAGLINLADLPAGVQTRFAYDPSKAAANEQWLAQNRALAPQAASPANSSSLASIGPAASATPELGGYSSGRVYVRGYYRKNGTYVQPHTRRR